MIFCNEMNNFSDHVQGGNLLLQRNIGHADWWAIIKNLGTPLLKCLGEVSQVTFIWRDPEGSECQSSTNTIYVEVNCLTDHHQAAPQQLTRVTGTDVWYWQTLIPSNWCGTYFFIPVTEAEQKTKKSNHRLWWRSILPFAIADPLNKTSPKYCFWGQINSLLYMPKASKNKVWQLWDESKSLQCSPINNTEHNALQHFNWSSSLLKNSRQIWLYDTQPSNVEVKAKKPLILLLDGEKWAELMPLFSVLQALTDQSLLPSAIYVFISNTSKQQRSVELGCNPMFWQAINDELLSEITKKIGDNVSFHQRCVVGQSLGGLAAMFAGLSRPEMFDHVICQSGSFWWPSAPLMSQWMDSEYEKEKRENGWLTTQVLMNKVVNKKVTITMQIGSKETRLYALNYHFYQSLIKTGHQVYLTEYCGGHDQVCWREGLINGLLQWLVPTSNPLENITTSRSKNTIVNRNTAHCG